MSSTEKVASAIVELEQARQPGAEKAAGKSVTRAVPKVSAWTRWRFGLWIPPLVTFVLLGIAWEYVAHSNPFVIPPLGNIAESIANDPSAYWNNLLVTLKEVAVGGGAAIVLGYLLAVLMCEFKILERALMPVVMVIMVTPVIAIAPALVVAFGFGMLPKYIVTIIVAIFPILINSLAGLRAVDPGTLDVLRVVDASRWEIFWRLRLPGSMPYFFAGLRIAIPFAIIGAAVAEFVAAGEAAGLGAMISIAASQANLEVTWAGISMFCVLGLLFVAVLTLLRRRVLWWDNHGRAPK
ncbi:ABC transporter permease [Nocardioides carbamazepini]|jgi:NitT/TauT family transport system permease protein|uniref:ABC transporter permease n=1 Tax=Nocardioides carbamazepini TaxID=2854259 RepID=UPI00214A67CB|nr:ABC transporter permease [Nocardioides carbamazepini]MCR1784753.1 ABC transporter permease [Nocardioides carbamazepini]